MIGEIVVMPNLRLLILFALTAVPQVVGAAAVQLPRTGQTLCYSATGAVTACAGTGQDGEGIIGVPWPEPRFTDNGNGTVTDHLTDLVWLRNAGCIPPVTWNAALDAANGLNGNQCGLSDNSVAGEWRLPNVSELESLIDLSGFTPAIPSGHPFIGLESSMYWTSTSHAHYSGNAWSINLFDGTVGGDLKNVNYRVLPVRGGR